MRRLQNQRFRTHKKNRRFGTDRFLNYCITKSYKVNGSEPLDGLVKASQNEKRPAKTGLNRLANRLSNQYSSSLKTR